MITIHSETFELKHSIGGDHYGSVEITLTASGQRGRVHAMRGARYGTEGKPMVVVQGGLWGRASTTAKKTWLLDAYIDPITGTLCFRASSRQRHFNRFKGTVAPSTLRLKYAG